MTPEEIIAIQKELGLSDGKMAKALGLTRQTWRNWRRGCKCPAFAQNSLIWMMELRRLQPANDNLPKGVRAIPAIASAAIVFTEFIAEVAA